jgi:hypothetical protein
MAYITVVIPSVIISPLQHFLQITQSGSFDRALDHGVGVGGVLVRGTGAGDTGKDDDGGRGDDSDGGYGRDGSWSL